jgi:hypothetical protein
MSWGWLKHAFRALIVVHFVVGVGVMVAVVLAPEMTIGGGQFDRVIGYVEETDFKWWVLGLVFGAWLLPLLVAAALQRAQQAGYRVDQLRRMLHAFVEGHSVPVVIDIDQKIPLQLDSALSLPVRLHTEVELDDTVDMQVDVPIQTELPLETDVNARIPGLGEVKIPIRAKVPIDVVVPIRGMTRIKARGVPIDINEIAVAEFPAVEIPVRFRLEAKIDILGNLLRAERLITGPDTTWMDRLRNGWARLRGILSRDTGPR